MGSACPACGTAVRGLGLMEDLRISRAKRQSRDKPKPQPSASSQKLRGSEALIAAFRADQYLGDPRCQKAMLELSRDWKGKNPAAEAIITPFHPLSDEEVKQARELDAFFLQSIRGNFNRVHFVIKGGVGSTNPFPDDSLCESCRAKGWLQKEYRISKVDGAVAAMWLCPNCVSPDPVPRPRKLDDIESAQSRTNLPLLDDNPKLLDLMLYALQPATMEVKQTGSMTPFAILETFASRRMAQSFKTGRLEMGYDEARRAILAAPPEVTRYVVAWLGYATIDGVRYETIFVGGGERGEAQGVSMGQRYKQHLPEVNYEPIGNLMIHAPRENLLTLSGDPNALAKLQPIFTRLTVDLAHKHGPGQDEALIYEFKKCSAVYLNLGDLDRPFREELQKKPDTVHVVVGRQSWITFFRPEANEVILARDTLVPVGDAPPFPGFKDDGIITIGYAPPSSALKRVGRKDYVLFVLWITMFKVTDKEV